MRTPCSLTRTLLPFSLALACLWLGQIGSWACYFGPYPTAEDFKQQEIIRLAGLNGDHSKIPMIMEALVKSPLETTTIMALHSLAQLGAVEAMPTIHAHAQRLENLFSVERARLLAEDSVRNIKDGKTRAREKIARFYQELNLTPDQLGPAAETYESHTGPWSHPPVPVEVDAMEEIADMVYHGSYKDYADVPGVAQVDFQHDYAAWIKMKMAPLSPKEQAAWLVNDLSHKKALRPQENYELHLAAELGLVAGPDVVAQMEKMDANRAEYPHGGWLAMFDLLGSTAPTQRDAIREHFKDDADPDVANPAKDSGGVERIAGY